MITALKLPWYLAYMSCIIVALDNGVARLPPMGWNSWVQFTCNVRCDIDPRNCISEQLYKEMADILVNEGYRDAGYEYVMVDDCWSDLSRDPATQRLRSDSERFPSGIGVLADYMHSRGLKLGLYASLGTQTCAGYPGSWNYLKIDATTFAEWEVDLIKLDGCHVPHASDLSYGYTAMGRYLNETGRHIVYSCEWPMYAIYQGAPINYSVMSSTCNMLRAIADVDNSFYTINTIIDYYATNSFNFSSYARPGVWNDPDQLVVGQSSLSEDQQRVQMVMWALWASPLVMSNDLRRISRRSKALLLNREIIAINQDPSAVQGTLRSEGDYLSVWSKPIHPPGSWAVAVLNSASSGGPLLTSVAMADLEPYTEIALANYYHVTSVLSESRLHGTFNLTDPIRFYVNPSGVYLFKAIIVN